MTWDEIRPRLATTGAESKAACITQGINKDCPPTCWFVSLGFANRVSKDHRGKVENTTHRPKCDVGLYKTTRAVDPAATVLAWPSHEKDTGSRSGQQRRWSPLGFPVERNSAPHKFPTLTVKSERLRKSGFKSFSGRVFFFLMYFDPRVKSRVRKVASVPRVFGGNFVGFFSLRTRLKFSSESPGTSSSAAEVEQLKKMNIVLGGPGWPIPESATGCFLLLNDNTGWSAPSVLLSASLLEW